MPNLFMYNMKDEIRLIFEVYNTIYKMLFNKNKYIDIHIVAVYTILHHHNRQMIFKIFANVSFWEGNSSLKWSFILS